MQPRIYRVDPGYPDFGLAIHRRKRQDGRVLRGPIGASSPAQEQERRHWQHFAAHLRAWMRGGS